MRAVLHTEGVNGILIVEDDSAVREALRLVLEAEGYGVHTEPDGRAAWTRLSTGEGCPTLILLDLMMPIMSGWELLARLRAEPSLRSIPVVVLSAAGELGDVSHAAEVLRKPLDLDCLLDIVERYRAEAIPG